MSKVRLNRKGRQVLTALVIIFIIIIMLAVFIGIKLYEKYSPTKERMHYEDYFEMLDPNEVLVYMNDEPLEIDVIYEDGRCYLPRTYVVENLNCRFYRNAGADFVMFTVADNIYSFATNEAYYTDMNGATVTTDYVIVKSRGDELYIAVDYVKQYADFIYRFYEEPSRLFNTRKRRMQLLPKILQYVSGAESRARLLLTEHRDRKLRCFRTLKTG